MSEADEPAQVECQRKRRCPTKIPIKSLELLLVEGNVLTRSSPRLPALPAHCLNISAVRNGESSTNTLVLMGMLIPSARVPVAMTTLINPMRKRLRGSV